MRRRRGGGLIDDIQVNETQWDVICKGLPLPVCGEFSTGISILNRRDDNDIRNKQNGFGLKKNYL